LVWVFVAENVVRFEVLELLVAPMRVFWSGDGR